ncbi:MAG: hypothetical protein HY698_13465 [Deltaproteobacteria bacterium]|nr:hypothetical protein [Deltaproteobacteria bacterium]
MSQHDQVFNLLIISDLHLGEDIKPHSKTEYLRHVLILERELEAFLDHYTKYRLDGRPWRLIVNGDMVDFLGVCLLPQKGEAEPDDEDVTPDDRVYGLGARPHFARKKMQKVLERHSGVFRALARFIGVGNHLSIVVGNHDVEFHWPIVQETFREGIAKLWAEDPSAERPGRRPVSEIASAIAFHPWFFFEENVVWVEHGHQYDEYCSFDYVLNPVLPKDEEICMNVGAAGLRYVANQVEGSYVAQQEDWSFFGYVRWALAMGAHGIAKMARNYFAMASRLLSLWRVQVKQPEAVEARRRTHRERLSALAAQCKLSEETLVALDSLRRRPIVLNFAKLLMAIMLDRLLVAVTAVVLVLVLVLALPWSWAIGSVSAVLGFAWATNWALSMARGNVDPVGSMATVPREIRRLTRAPYVVFGHSHDPLALKLEDGGWYFNTGTWVATEKPGILRAFTHLLIRHGENGPQAALCQWRDGRSRVLDPEHK